MGDPNREQEDANNEEYAKNYARGRSGHFLSDLGNSCEDPDSIEYKAYKAGEHDRANYGYKSEDECGTGERDEEPSSGLCYLTTACTTARGLPDNCLELTTLRGFRDKFMMKTPSGRKDLKEYYRTAPEIVSAVNSLPSDLSSRIWEGVYQDVRKAVQLVRTGRFNEAHTHYRAMTLKLKRERF